MTLQDKLAKAIYETHWKEGNPPWDMASEAVKDWVKQQAQSAHSVIMEHLRADAELPE